MQYCGALGLAEMAMAGLYRRILPSPPAVDFSSTQGKELFLEGIQRGTMESFYKLISYFQTQSEPAYCGLASLSMVLNALAIDPGRKWKGPWRWFDESMLDCCEPLDKVRAKGISFSKLVCLAQCAGAKVEAFRTNQSSVDEFRKYVMKCSTSDDSHVISSYQRGTFKQTGTGHFSPIGGYHAEKDMALILDVARFKYPPHWVPLPLLWEAMDNVDEASGQRRGFMVVSRPQREPGLLYTLSCKHESWISIAKYLMDDVPGLLRSDDVKDLCQVISVVFSSLPSNFGEFIKWVAEVRRPEDDGQSLSEEEKGRVAIKEEVLRQVQQTYLFKHVQGFLISSSRSPETKNYNTKEKLPDLAASVCCQAAEFYAGMSCLSGEYCYRATCVRCMKANDDKRVTVVSGTVSRGASEQGLDVLVPSSQPKPSCCGRDPCTCAGPAASDILTVLLLALPPRTWSGIKDEMLLNEMHSLISIENLPVLLQEEVMHLRQQLQILNQCQENKGFIQESMGISPPLFSPLAASAGLKCSTQESRGISKKFKGHTAEPRILWRSCHSWKQRIDV